MPPAGPLIIASNHASHLDIPLLGCTLHRRAFFVGKSELFGIPVFGRLLRHLGGIPLRRAGIDRRAVDEIKKRLQEGHVLVFYLEGKRTTDGRLQRAKAGIGMVASMTGAQVVPAYIKGTFQALPKGRKLVRSVPVTITYGAPLSFPQVVGGDEEQISYQEMADRVMGNIASLAQSQGYSEDALVEGQKNP